MIKITWHSIDLGVYVDSYKDGTWSLRSMYTLDPKGEIYEELPPNMLTERADTEIEALIQKALDCEQPESDGPDVPDYPQYTIRGVQC
jgi:hypothetical protein